MLPPFSFLISCPSPRHMPLNIYIISHLLFLVNSPDIQTFPLLFMEVPILQKGRSIGIIKLPQRSESNVQVNLKTTESEVTKMLEPNNCMK